MQLVEVFAGGGHHLAIAAILRERRCGSLARVALDLERVRAPKRIAMVYLHLALVGPTGLSASGRTRQQQRIARHHPVDALGIHARSAGIDPLPVHPCASAPTAVTAGENLFGFWGAVQSRGNSSTLQAASAS